MGDSWFHEIDGIKWPRATSVIETLREPGLDAWRARVGDVQADKVARRTARVGTKIHSLIDKTLTGGKPARLPKKSPPDVLRAWETWLGWYAAQQDFHPTSGETLMVNRELGYSGTPDCVEDVAAIQLHRVDDWKCTSRLREAMWLQLACYCPLIWPDTWRTLDIKLRIVRIDPNLGLFEEAERPLEHWMLDEFFLPLLKIYRKFYFLPALARQEAVNAT